MLMERVKKTSRTLLEATNGLAGRIARLANGVGQTDLMAGLKIFRLDAPIPPSSCMYEPSVAIIAQGRKRVLLEEEVYVYGAEKFLITSVDVPLVGEVLEASRQRPYLSAMLKLDQRVISQLMAEGSLPPPRLVQAGRGVALGETTAALVNAFERLLDLVEEPRDIPVMAPIIQREITYRLLISEQGARLRQIASAGTQGHQIARAIEWLKGNYMQTLRVEELAGRVQMSASTFHHHFRAMTAMSPLQFQKQLRLHEARRLMLSGSVNAATAAFEVGYESPSQFTREYGRLFGESPSKDVAKLRAMGVGIRGMGEERLAS